MGQKKVEPQPREKWTPKRQIETLLGHCDFVLAQNGDGSGMTFLGFVPQLTKKGRIGSKQSKITGDSGAIISSILERSFSFQVDRIKEKFHSAGIDTTKKAHSLTVQRFNNQLTISVGGRRVATDWCPITAAAMAIKSINGRT